MAVNHQHLRAFHAVANDGSFSRAARRLNISQPTLSQQIKALEVRYGSNLFEARRVPLRLTPLGRELHRLTGQMFATSDAIEFLLRDQHASGTLALRLVADAPAWAARLVRALLSLHPGAQVSVQIANAPGTLQALRDARADAAIVSDPQIDPALIYRPLFSDHLAMVVARDHPCAADAGFPLARLAQECLLLREPSSRTRGAGEALLTAHDVVPARTIELDSREAIREAIALGLGVSLFVASECPPDPRLAVLPIESLGQSHSQSRGPAIAGYLVHAAERKRSVAIQAILAAASLVLGAAPELPEREIPPAVREA